MSVIAVSVCSADFGVVDRAKRYARGHGTWVSRMVEHYLALVSEPSDPGKEPPVLRSLRGSLKNAGVEDYRGHLRKKYRG